MANDQDMSSWIDLLHSSTKLLEQAAPSARFPPLQRDLDQLEALSKKLEAKTLRTAAPSQSIDAARLLAREGNNAEQLAQDLKSFELKVSIMPRLSLPDAPRIEIPIDFNIKDEEEGNPTNQHMADIHSNEEDNSHNPSEFFEGHQEDQQHDSQFNVELPVSQTNFEAGSSSITYEQHYLLKGDASPLRKDESVFEDLSTLLNFVHQICTKRNRESHLTSPRLYAKFQKIHNHASGLLEAIVNYQEALEAERVQADLKKEIEELKSKNATLEGKNKDLEVILEDIKSKHQEEIKNLKEENKKLDLQLKKQKYKMSQDCMKLVSKIAESYTSVWTHDSARCFRFGWHERGLDASKRYFPNGPSDFDAKYEVNSRLPTPSIPDIDLEALGIKIIYSDPTNEADAQSK